MMDQPQWAEGEFSPPNRRGLENSDAIEARMMSWLAEHNKQEIFQQGVRAAAYRVFPVYNLARGR